MDITACPESTQKLHQKDKVYPYELYNILDAISPEIKVLSLDCFDTLLWRKVATPIDVFYDLQHRPAFKTHRINSYMRASAESHARKIKSMNQANQEVTLKDIYLNSLHHLNADQINELTTDELSAEIETCYALPATVELIRRAHAKGIEIIIVSDTYFNEQQLNYLLENALPQNVKSFISRIFCSSEYGTSKSKDFFHHVLKTLNIPSKSILHIGDNFTADFESPRRYNIQSLHLIQHTPDVNELLRMQMTSLSYIDPSIRYTRGLNQPFRGLLAIKPLFNDKPEHLIGYATIGPIMFAFANFIHEEIKTLKAKGKNPKIIFLLRDAYLPSCVYQTLFHDEIVTCVPISRFVSIASALRTANDIDRYIAGVIDTQRFKEMCRQLLLPDHISKPFLETLQKSDKPAALFYDFIHQENILSIIFHESAQFRNRLKQHLIKKIGLTEGDTLVLVDLGYSGTTQTLLEPVFRDTMNVEIMGLYLISLPIAGWEKSRKGLLDPGTYDQRILYTLVNYIALLEQICTSDDKSVIGYSQEGEPIYSDSNTSDNQHIKLKDIQASCLDFAREANDFLQKTSITLSQQTLKDVALGGLSRFLFLPTKCEINYLESFEFEVNLGTNDVLKVFDSQSGLISLRRRGLFYSFMEKSGKSIRMNYPAELRAAGIELSLTMMAQHRYGLELGVNDLSLRQEKINVIIIKNNNTLHTEMHANYTHDGYFSLLIPIGSGSCNIGVLFGQKYQFIQLESVELIKVHAYLQKTETHYTNDIWSNLVFNQMSDKGDKLFECISPEAITLAMINPPANETDNLLVRIIYRPIVTRKSNTAVPAH